jgi:tetracycline 7-halogenase / FADH2 O2-dependent halogenase
VIRESADIAVLGGGFAGCLMALVLQRIGKRAVVLERGSHPRFAIGESSTPLCNLSLESIARDFDLPRLMPLTEYGRWQRTYPTLACGLKRGFTFAKHQENRPFVPRADHANELLVAASPSDDESDTHWFRADFDHFIAEEAKREGILFLDRTEVLAVERDERWTVRGARGEESVEIRAEFVVDASGPAGLLGRALGIDSRPCGVRTNAWSVYSHFENVGLWADVLSEAGGSVADHPYRCDDAALHHVLADGWIWVLRFNNGITSAGAMLDATKRQPDSAFGAEEEWLAILGRYPSIARQFASARAIRPFTRTGRLQRRTRRSAGDGWAMLAHAAYFLDPLFSGGNAHSLLTVERLARILREHWGRPGLRRALAAYNRLLLREVNLLDRMIHGCYECFGRFESLSAFVMDYFAAAIHCEKRRRSGALGPEGGFLFADDAEFRAKVRRHYRLLTQVDARELERQVACDLAPINVAGLCDPAKRNMYPFV